MPVSFIQKAKDRIGLIVSVGALIGMIFGVAAYSEGQTEDQIRDAGLIQQGRNEAVHSSQARAAAVQNAKHDYDFYEVRGVQAEQELQYLEEDVDDGVRLTASQERKMRRLEEQVTDFQSKQDDALEKLEQAEEAADASE